MPGMMPPADRRRALLHACLHQLRLFFIALQFFTRLPIPRWVGFEPEWLFHAARYFPAVGIVVAAFTAGSYALAVAIWPQPVAVLLSTIVGIYLTGAFHEDGFADMCDGFGGGMTKERVLDIMKDSRIGAYGAIGIALLIGLKCVTLAMMPAQAVVMALLAAHPLSRFLATCLIRRLEYVKEEGKSKPLAHRLSGREWTVGLVTALLPLAAWVFIDNAAWAGLLIGVIAAALAAGWLARMFVRRIGGYTGDCLGAVQQASEVAFYLGLLAMLRA